MTPFKQFFPFTSISSDKKHWAMRREMMYKAKLRATLAYYGLQSAVWSLLSARTAMWSSPLVFNSQNLIRIRRITFESSHEILIGKVSYWTLYDILIFAIELFQNTKTTNRISTGFINIHKSLMINWQLDATFWYDAGLSITAVHRPIGQQLLFVWLSEHHKYQHS